MLNYNLNIIEPLKQDKKNEDVRPPINWDFHSFASASDSTDLPELGFATMSINAFNTNCVEISNDSGNTFITDAQSAVSASMTGSNWPITGSTTMSMFTFGISYDPSTPNIFLSEAISASALDIFNNPSYTGSKITNNFLATEFVRFYTSGSVIHMKGNVSNANINWLATGSYTSSWNRNSGSIAQFNIVKDRNVSKVSVPFVTSSYSSSFDNFYALNITASLTASSDWPFTQSFLFPTMSLSIPEAGITLYSYTTASILSASFVAQENINNYNITGSAWANVIPRLVVSILGVGAGASGLNNKVGQKAGSGGGGGAATFIDNFNIIPNRYYSYTAGTSSQEPVNGESGSGQDTSLTGWGLVNEQIVSMSLKLQGGRPGRWDVSDLFSYGGDSGTGSYVIGSSTTLINKFNGGTGSWDVSAGGVGAGGAGSTQTGSNNVGTSIGGRGGDGFSNTNIFGYINRIGAGGGGAGDDAGTGGLGGTTGGGNGGRTDLTSATNASWYGSGGGGGDTGADASLGYNGLIAIQYTGKPKLTFTGDVLTSTINGITTHLIQSGSGTIIYPYEPNPDPNLAESSNIETLIIAGGGAGTDDGGAGGGAGGYRYDTGSYINYTNTYTIFIGGGATAGASTISGSNSYIVNEQTGEMLLAFGGGNGNGNNGGSGGGGARSFGAGGSITGSSPIGTNQGSVGSTGGDIGQGGGSGGGASQAGSNSYGGGSGKYDISFTPLKVCGGGQGAANSGNISSGSQWGGGSYGTTGSSGQPATGGGGGASNSLSSTSPGSGGSGKVQIKYIGTPIATGGTIETQIVSGSYYTLHTFTESGRFLPISGSRPVPTY